jgi:predicted HD phosphohydrolase
MSTDQQLARAHFKTFEESTPADWAIINEQSVHAEMAVADNALHLLRQLGDDYGGFPVSRLEHSLQTATRAQRDGRDDEYVVCALLHDIGDTLSPGMNHPDIAASMVHGLASEANHFMVKWHGYFQGYYFWDKIGGDKNARERFRESPYFDYAAEFCALYDQVAFDPDYQSESLDHFEPLVRAFFAPRTGMLSR